MRSNRRRNWFLKRIALGLAVAAVAAPVAQASVDVGIPGQPNSPAEVGQAFAYADHGMPSALPSEFVLAAWRPHRARAGPRGWGRPATDFVASDYGMPRAMPHDYAVSSGHQIEVVRSTPERERRATRSSSSARSRAPSVSRRSPAASVGQRHHQRRARLVERRLDGRWDRRWPRSRTRPPRRRSGACKPPRRPRADRLAAPNQSCAHRKRAPRPAYGCFGQRSPLPAVL